MKHQPSKTQAARVRALLERYPQTFAQELGIGIERNTPVPLFELLTAALMFSARISHDKAAQATRALFKARLTSPRKLAGATWQQRVDVITWHGYKRYDERTASMLGELAERVTDEYGGDLRRLRKRAEQDPTRERQLLQEFNGIGPVGADIFLREVQVAWEEVYPFADAKVLQAARRLQLPADIDGLKRLVRGRQRFAVLTAALVRVDLDDSYAEVKAA